MSDDINNDLEISGVINFKPKRTHDEVHIQLRFWFSFRFISLILKIELVLTVFIPYYIYICVHFRFFFIFFSVVECQPSCDRTCSCVRLLMFSFRGFHWYQCCSNYTKDILPFVCSFSFYAIFVLAGRFRPLWINVTTTTTLNTKKKLYVEANNTTYTRKQNKTKH